MSRSHLERRRSLLVALTLLLGSMLVEAQAPTIGNGFQNTRRSSQDLSPRSPTFTSSVASVAAELESDLHKRGLLDSIACALGVKSACPPPPVIDTTRDVNNCGAIGLKCPSSFANGVGSVTCSAGKCISACRSGFGFSTARGACIDTTSDAQNCGSVGAVCSFANGVGKCSNSACFLASCQEGFTMFGSSCQPSSFMTDPKNCGTAGNVCSLTSGATGMSCVGGSCQASECDTGFRLSGSSCQRIDTQSDVDNCGRLGLKCATSFSNGVGSTCTSGTCRPVSCVGGYAFDMAIAGCRAITDDPDNCGRVGNVCSAQNGLAGCVEGQCRTVSCFAPYQMLNGLCVDNRPQPSSRARVKKSKKPLGLCPTGERACPIAGSKAFLQARSTNFNEFRASDPLGLGYLPSGGFECLDTNYSLESCGGCTSMGEGKNCLDIPFVNGVGCDAGKCTIFSCQVGYKLSKDGSTCVRSTPARKKTSAHGRHHGNYSGHHRSYKRGQGEVPGQVEMVKRSRVGPARQSS
ncbi:hypothetical protein OIO90_000788 [Microbotryomycetes sp. JL221]|nr:hypothetical protein OIO90_000788 [Microbotryomycetes sp. JL221]